MKKRHESFITKVDRIIEENIEDEAFGITELCSKVFFSRSQLHNKIKAATGISTSNYINRIRVENAALLLLETEMNISEVAYRVGCKDPGYFSRLFKFRYKQSPSEYRKLKINNSKGGYSISRR